MDTDRQMIVSELRSKAFIKWKNEGLKSSITGKDELLSKTFRELSNNHFSTKPHNGNLHSSVLMLYSKSIACALGDSEDLALAYNNRSALLLHLRKYKESMEDVERASNITKQEKVIVELYCRKAECLNALGFGQESMVAWQTGKSHFGKVDDKDKNNVLTTIIRVKRILDSREVSIFSCRFIYFIH